MQTETSFILEETVEVLEETPIRRRAHVIGTKMERETSFILEETIEVLEGTIDVLAGTPTRRRAQATPIPEEILQELIQE